MPYLVITEQCEIDTRNHRNGDIEPRASQAVELLHGGWMLSFGVSNRAASGPNELNELNETKHVSSEVQKKESTSKKRRVSRSNEPSRGCRGQRLKRASGVPLSLYRTTPPTVRLLREVLVSRGQRQSMGIRLAECAGDWG